MAWKPGSRTGRQAARSWSRTSWGGSLDASPALLTKADDALFFLADDGTHGQELWKSDGTADGTRQVKDISPGSTGIGVQNCSVFAGSLTAAGETLYFAADDGTHGCALWKSDGTEAGSLLVKDGIGYPRELTDVGGTLFFVGFDSAYGQALWRTDGTEAGTVVVKAFQDENGVAAVASELTNVNGTLFFSVRDAGHGQELWKSDGTEAGTVLVKDIFPGTGDSYPLGLASVNGMLFFSANDGTHGSELWKSDGTAAGTVLVKDIQTDNAGLLYGSFPHSFVAVNDTLYFIAGAAANGIWKTDGTAAGTIEIFQTANGGPLDGSLTDVNGTLYFAANDGMHGAELWKSDGTHAGTALVKDVNVGSLSAFAGVRARLLNVGGTLFFVANDGIHGTELWQSDGTAEGTILAADISAVGDSNPSDLTSLNGVLFLAATDGAHGRELWRFVGPEPSLPGFTVKETVGQTIVSEFGTTDTIAIVLTAPPNSNVVIDVTSGDAGEMAVSPAKLTFTPANWNVPQTVTVSGVDDAVSDGHQTSIVTLSVNEADSDDGYDAVADQTVSVTTADNDSAMDTDSDNVDDVIEDAHPNNGDGNGDGVLDGHQAHVASLPSLKTGAYVTLAGTPGTSLGNVKMVGEPVLPPALNGIGLPIGFLDFALTGLTPGGATTVTVYLEDGAGINTFYKFGPTPKEPEPHWYRFLFDGRTGAEFFADRIVVHYVDGQRGDDDLAVNGAIRDLGGPAADNRAYPWQNPFSRFDVNDDRRISAEDVLFLINRPNQGGPRNLPAPVGGPDAVRHFLDVHPDHALTAQDVLSVINEINARGVRDLGESEFGGLLAGKGEMAAAPVVRALAAPTGGEPAEAAGETVDLLMANLAAAAEQRTSTVPMLTKPAVEPTPDELEDAFTTADDTWMWPDADLALG